MLDRPQQLLILGEEERLLAWRGRFECVEDGLHGAVQQALALLLADGQQGGRTLQVGRGLSLNGCQVNLVIEPNGPRGKTVGHHVQCRQVPASEQ